MCRLAAYLGPDLLLQDLLNEEPHSLVKQSWACNELKGTTLNADGYGFGWYQDDSSAAYTSTLPIWSDSNLPDLARTLSRNLWLAYVRSATPGQPLNQANTQPFRTDDYLFLHNGRIEDFNAGPRTLLHEHLQAELASQIEGNTDSEYLFALLRQKLLEDDSLTDALRRSCQDIESLLADNPALLNMIVSDGDAIYACRHALNDADCPSLYYTNSHPAFPDAVLIASEPFSHREHWQSIAAHSLLKVNAKREIDISGL